LIDWLIENIRPIVYYKSRAHQPKKNEAGVIVVFNLGLTLLSQLKIKHKNLG